MSFSEFFMQLTWRSVLDIALVALLLYQIIAILKGTRAAQILIGMLVLFIAYILSSLLEFETLNWIISKFYSSVILVIIVLFQDDIRRLLTRFGRSPFVSTLSESSGIRVIDEVIGASKMLSHDRIGAIIVFERTIGLDKLYDHSVRVDSLVSEQLLICIFQSFSPLHDGAVILQKNRISCASAHLPLSKNPSLGKKLGTRHSAAVGISEETDAVVLVISEETGAISLAWNGNLQVQQSLEGARRNLISLLLPSQEKSNFGRLVERSLFTKSNEWYLKVQNKVKTSHSYEGEERRRGSDRSRRDEALFDATHDDETPEKPVKLRFSHDSKIKTAHADASGLVTSFLKPEKGGEEGNKSQSSPERRRPSEDGSVNQTFRSSGHHGGMDDSHDDSLHPVEKDPYREEGIMENEALKSLVHLAPEDKFVPPVVPSSPPRNVSIGGVSLDPPLDSVRSESEQKPKKPQ